MSLYQPEQTRDNCGFGLIAQMDGQASHHLVETAIEALARMTHRGGIASDGKTGDGCGLLMKKPEAFFREAAQDLGAELSKNFGVGMVFLSKDADKAQHAKNVLSQEITKQDLEVAIWRSVPVDSSVCGEIGLATLPDFEQVLINCPDDMDAFELERKLFLARRSAEKLLADDKDFYVPSLSGLVIVYKGLVIPEDLPKFYLDLADQRLASAVCVFHQRFSTNTLPQWRLAQPFRFLAHNGEINTIAGNRNWSLARQAKFETDLLPGLKDIRPLVNRDGSDSSSLDNMLEVFLAGGMSLYRAMRLLLPPAWQNHPDIDDELKAFYSFNSMHMEPWDGPAGIVMTNGRYAACNLDRNGLRPARYVITKDRMITLASEIGVWEYKAEDVVDKGRVGPGQMLVVDTETGKLYRSRDIDHELKTRFPYREWLEEHSERIISKEGDETAFAEAYDPEHVAVQQKLFQVTFEERDQVVGVLGDKGQEAVGSMGDDTPMAVLSKQKRSVYDYFRQQFAQVTNPPIDPLREAIVMSLETCIGQELNIFEETKGHAYRMLLDSPVLTNSEFKQLLELKDSRYKEVVISLNVDKSTSLQQAVVDIADAAEKAARDGVIVIVLSDKNISKDSYVVPAAMATGAVHHRLVEQGLRCDSNIVVETGSARDPHQFAVLLGFGATAVYPYLAYSVLCDMYRAGESTTAPEKAFANFRKGINKGLLKIMSKMGISCISSYRGAQLFEAVGLHDEITSICFKGVASRVQGAQFKHIQADQVALSRHAWLPRKRIEQGGLLKYIHGGEYHAYNPDVVSTIQEAVKTGSYAKYKEYAEIVNSRPVAMFRDMMKLREDVSSIALDEVEPVEAIVKRFDSAGMSLGALSKEAHEALAVAMNRLGGRSNSGEGGESVDRYGTERMSKIKQVASGRFGVTPHYLRNAEVIQIKVAQGAKPGEGGQLPGHKVSQMIAELRYSVPGVTLISPPPHHDIYSIEDLAQLIYDLKQVNPSALVSVKLVAEPGVGTIAAGVAKAYADLVTISGYDGGTGASPLTSVKYAGTPWELGIAETQQSLVSNHLRDKIRVQVDGGLKTGLDVVKGAILGAESFGFGTGPMVALGCKYLRICHLNNCATGVATQNDKLRRDHFIGLPEMVMNYFNFIAEETREWLAKLGVASLEALIGRIDLLEVIEGTTDKQRALDLSNILDTSYFNDKTPLFCQVEKNEPYDKGELAEEMVAQTLSAIEAKSGGEFSFNVKNFNRSIGARVSGEIAVRYGNHGMNDAPITIKLTGTAGQSFGVWNAGGLHMYLEGDSNDYVGKGMAGGLLAIYPPKVSEFKSNETAIIGNTCLYGATGGHLYAAGIAGERFGVRNSRAHAVVEGVGDHCCEYMTGGSIVVLGETGVNFGAGMTGGFAYVYDAVDKLESRYNPEFIELLSFSDGRLSAHHEHLKAVIEQHVKHTGSQWGQYLLDNFESVAAQFKLVKPKAADLYSLLDSQRDILRVSAVS
tara:strand:- start:35120 stop:39577 length:4458 start_codon:yes stop_codon:yes gene_type:complete